jgi:hypothetical protein
MRAIQKVIGLGLRPWAERRGRGRTLEDAARHLERAGATIDEHLAGKADTPAQREAVAHCVGIERWGHSRLRVGLGEPLRLDGHRGYRPDPAVGLDALRALMAETRATTVALARELEAAGVDPATTVRHNDLGDLTLSGWLAYLEQHATRELMVRVRG